MPNRISRAIYHINRVIVESRECVFESHIGFVSRLIDRESKQSNYIYLIIRLFKRIVSYES